MAGASLFLLHLLSIISLSRASVNIDCGTLSGSSVDKNNLTWVGDEGFITAGEPAMVASTTIEKSFTTLRYFPTGDSNCYSNIPVTKGGKILVRTLFYYGYYDGKSRYPTFDVLIDRKYRHSVVFSSATMHTGVELIFAPEGREICVCFIRTSAASNPFVSAIEVVDLDAGMYHELSSGEGLLYQSRLGLGLTKFVRSDNYGRFWFPADPGPWDIGPTSTAASIDTSDASNQPPEIILRNSWSGEGLTFGGGLPFPSPGVPVYLAMYFSNPVESSLRSFNIFFNGRQVNKDPVVPVFGKATQIVFRDMASSSSMLEFRSTANMVFPPLLNAVELYLISNPTSGGGGVPPPGRRVGPEPGHGPGGDSQGNKISDSVTLPLGIGVPVCVLTVIGYYIWKCIIKPRRQQRSQVAGHGACKQEVNVKVNVCSCWTWCK